MALDSPAAALPVELCSGVDALYLSGRAELPASLVESLDEARSRAGDAGEPVDHSLGGYPARVLPGAWGLYRYCAWHELGRFGFTASTHLPAVRVQPNSKALHSLGPAMTVLWVRNVLDAVGVDADLQVSRLDLHADFHGLRIVADDRHNFVTCSDRRALYEVAEELSGLNFGKRGGAVYARIYDKTREMASKGDNWWPEVWGANYRADQPVQRVEFEFGRDGLREFGVNTPEDAFEKLGELWAYATQSWLSLRVPSGDRTRSRWGVDPRWKAVQRVTLAENCIPARRIDAGRRAGGLRRLMPALNGYIAAFGALTGNDTIEDACAALPHHLRAYERSSRRSFCSRVDGKRRERA